MLVRSERVDASRPRGAFSVPRKRKSIEVLVSRSASRLCTPTKRPKSCLQLISPRARILQLVTLRLRPPSFLPFNDYRISARGYSGGYGKMFRGPLWGPQCATNTVPPATNLIEAILFMGNRLEDRRSSRLQKSGDRRELNTMLKPHKEQLDCGDQCFFSLRFRKNIKHLFFE